MGPDCRQTWHLIVMGNTLRINEKLVHDFLRFQVGRYEKRKMVVPIYDGKTVVSKKTIPEETTVWRVLGFGSTQKKAEQMAAKSNR